MRAKLKCLTIPKEECTEYDVGVQNDSNSRINGSSRINLVTNFMKKKKYSFHYSPNAIKND
jgi:hypothetical protein